MSKPSPEKTAAAKRLALLNLRQEQEADAPKALAEYRVAQQAAIDRMHQLRALRLARNAKT